METIHPLVYIGLLLLLSYTGGKAANYFKAPRVTGYLVIGVLLSPSLLGLFHESLIKEDLTLVTEIALSIIAFSIGGSLNLIKLKKLGKHIFWITPSEAICAFLATTGILVLFFPFVYAYIGAFCPFWNLYFPMALVIGALCSATAPAATLAIIHEYGSKGPLTSIILGVVALDDALAIIFFAFAGAIAHIFIGHESINWQNLLILPVYSIFIYLFLGGAAGLFLRYLIRFISRESAMLTVMSGSIFLVAGLSISLKTSPLLANMMLGFMVANFVKHNEDLFAVVESIEEPIFGMFFTLAGAHMDFKVMQTAGLIALVITLGRFSGKLLGSRFGSQISHAPKDVKKYLGFALMPSAGVAVGLVLEVGAIFGPSSLLDIMVNAVLGSRIINELMTPFFVRFALRRAGEA
ncbi:MAG: cation:proton antiporter [Bacteroidales bacterium]|jgi:Kef-type K+ transport system membrane component KefB|nr:cation:proton antiporter [Bacteroidales bacterium]